MGEDRISLSRLIESLIERVNRERKWLLTLALVSITVAPLSFFVSVQALTRPRMLHRLRLFDETLYTIFMVSTVLNLLASFVWIVVGIKEVRFVLNWNKRFRRYLDLRNKVDVQLGLEEKE